METIFVQLSSYHDYELPNTIKSAVENSSGEYEIHFGVHHIYYENDDIQLPNVPNLRVVKSQAPANLGMGLGRLIAHRLYQNENYYVQVDSHTRFLPNWDKTFIEDIKHYQDLGIKKPVVTAYPKNYWYNDEGVVEEDPVGTSMVISFHERPEFFKNSRYTSQTAMPNPTGNIYTRSVSGGSVFTVGPFIDPNPKILAAGEELVIAARAYTHGYDMVLPREIVIAHLYYDHSKPANNKRRLVWNDFPDIIKELDAASQAEMKHLFLNAPIGPDGFGTERTLEDFGRFVGLDFQTGEIIESQCCK